MASSVVLERGSSAVAPFSGGTPGWQPGTVPAGSPAAANWCVLPRCEVEFEKCTGGFKIHCRCDDEVACGTLQNLCRMLCDGLCSCYCTCNGICCCQCNLTVRHLQVRIHQGRLLHQLHVGRQGLLRDSPIVLRLPRDLLQERLLLLHLLQQHAGLLRHLLSCQSSRLLAN